MAVDELVQERVPLEVISFASDNIPQADVPLPSTLSEAAKYQRLIYFGVVTPSTKAASQIAGYQATAEGEENPFNVYIPLSALLAQQPYGLREQTPYQKPIVLDAANYLPRALAGLPADDLTKGYRDVMSKDSLYTMWQPAEQYALNAELMRYGSEYREPTYAERKTYDAKNVLLPKDGKESDLEMRLEGTAMKLPFGASDEEALRQMLSDPLLQQFVRQRVRVVAEYGIPIVDQRADAFAPQYDKIKTKMDYAEKEHSDDRKMAEIDARGGMIEEKVMAAFGDSGEPKEFMREKEQEREIYDTMLKAA